MNQNTHNTSEQRPSASLYHLKQAFSCLRDALFVLFRLELPRKWQRFKDRWLGPLVEYEPGEQQQGPAEVNLWHIAFIVAMIVLTWAGMVMEG